MDLSNWLSLFDFKFEMENGKIALIDLQGANLGGIESERFDTVSEVIDRMDIYINDSLLNGEILIDDSSKNFETVQEAYGYCKRNGYTNVLPYFEVIMYPDTVKLN